MANKAFFIGGVKRNPFLAKIGEYIKTTFGAVTDGLEWVNIEPSNNVKVILEDEEMLSPDNISLFNEYVAGNYAVYMINISGPAFKDLLPIGKTPYTFDYPQEYWIEIRPKLFSLTIPANVHNQGSSKGLVVKFFDRNKNPVDIKYDILGDGSVYCITDKIEREYVNYTFITDFFVSAYIINNEYNVITNSSGVQNVIGLDLTPNEKGTSLIYRPVVEDIMTNVFYKEPKVAYRKDFELTFDKGYFILQVPNSEHNQGKTKNLTVTIKNESNAIVTDIKYTIDYDGLVEIKRNMPFKGHIRIHNPSTVELGGLFPFKKLGMTTIFIDEGFPKGVKREFLNNVIAQNNLPTPAKWYKGFMEYLFDRWNEPLINIPYDKDIFKINPANSNLAKQVELVDKVFTCGYFLILEKRYSEIYMSGDFESLKNDMEVDGIATTTYIRDNVPDDEEFDYVLETLNEHKESNLNVYKVNLKPYSELGDPNVNLVYSLGNVLARPHRKSTVFLPSDDTIDVVYLVTPLNLSLGGIMTVKEVTQRNISYDNGETKEAIRPLTVYRGKSYNFKTLESYTK